jgi:DNA-binding transcriptional MerR regulator
MPDSKKTYFSISEVCERTSLEAHVLRYWETEFPQLRPKKNRSGNRAYREKDIEIIRYIKYLLYEEQYTILGAKKKCADMKNEPQQVRLILDERKDGVDLHYVKNELRGILQTLTTA